MSSYRIDRLRPCLRRDLAEIGAYLRASRMAKGLRVQSLADRLGCSCLTIWNIENGYPVRMSTLYDYAAAVGATVRIAVYAPLLRCKHA